MSQTGDLDPFGGSVEVGSVAVRASGFTGRVELLEPADVDSRGQQLTTEQLAAAMAEADVSDAYTVELGELRRADASTDGRGQEVAEDIVLEVPAPAADEGQVLMLVEEDGVITWHLPEPLEDESRTRDRAMVAFRVPARTVEVTAVDPPPEDRGLVSMIGSKVLRVLTFPLTPLLRAAGTAFTRSWEEKHRHARFRALSSGDYTTDVDVVDLDEEDWKRLSKGPSLLFLHGTFASAHNAFGQLPRDVLDELSDRYGGRVFALDHHSVWLPPSANAKLVAETLPDLPMEVDIVAHSRGGLVARELAERATHAGIGDSFRVRRVVMVGTPNAGTALAEEANIRKWLDIVTNLAQFVPDNPVTDIIALVLTALKQLALGVFEGLHGLTSMDPAGDYLRVLNVDGDVSTSYFAIAAEFEPPEGSALRRMAEDLLVDTLFSGNGNDLVVPTDGVSVVDGLARFAPEKLVLTSAHGVDHMSFFKQPEVIAKLREWLPG